jgi:hypothetical protein
MTSIEHFSFGGVQTNSPFFGDSSPADLDGIHSKGAQTVEKAHGTKYEKKFQNQITMTIINAQSIQ